MKYKFSPNPAFNFTMGYIGGFDDIPTKQDKFKPVQYRNIRYDNELNETVALTENLYVLSGKRREGQKKFEEDLKNQIRDCLSDDHPYKKPTQLEVVLGINTSTKRLGKVDIDNLVKCVLDCLNGLVYEDDSQIASLIASKRVIKDDYVPEQSGLVIGVRVLSKDRRMLNNVKLYYIESLEE